jgi:hypothetical protein
MEIDEILSMQARRRWASILMTYSCTIACSHCCFNCAPDLSAPVITPDDAVRALRDFHQLDRSIHIAGGEPFQHYDRLMDIVRRAHEAGVPPHFVETNASWCVSDDLVRGRFEELREHGVLWMLISSDPYHLRIVPVENVWRGLRLAEEVFGTGTTMGFAPEEELRKRAAISRDPAQWQAFILANPPMLVGRAFGTFEHMLPPRSIDALQLQTGWGIDPADTCCGEWDPLWEIHVDPYGNVQTNCGIVLGNMRDKPVGVILDTWNETDDFLADFSKRGVAALLEAAKAHGYEPREEYPQKCFLCMTLRRFLRDADPRYKRIFAPDEIYAV